MPLVFYDSWIKCPLFKEAIEFWINFACSINHWKTIYASEIKSPQDASKNNYVACIRKRVTNAFHIAGFQMLAKSWLQVKNACIHLGPSIEIKIIACYDFLLVTCISIFAVQAGLWALSIYCIGLTKREDEFVKETPRQTGTENYLVTIRILIGNSNHERYSVTKITTEL